jgi:uncharacterized BrkB/YihY/UPF0761 family membrane protein
MWQILADSSQYHGSGGALGGAIITMILVWLCWPKNRK